MEQPIQQGGKNLPMGVSSLSPEGLGREQPSKPGINGGADQGTHPQGRIRHDSSRAFGCVPGSPAMRPKSPHPANSYGNAKSPWNSTNSNYSPASPFPQTPSPALSFNPSCPPSPFSPRDRHTNTYLGNTSMRAVGDLAHNSIVDMKDGCFKAPPTPSSMGSSPATPATPEANNHLQNNSPPGEVPNSPVTLPGKSPPRASEFVNSPNSTQQNAKSNPILNELLSDTKHAASRQVGSPGGLVHSPKPISQQQQQQHQQQMLQQQQVQVQMDVDPSRDLNTAAPSAPNIHLQQQQQRFVGMPSQPPNAQALFQQQQLARQQQQQQLHQHQMYLKQQQHQQQLNQQRLMQQQQQVAQQRGMSNNGGQQGSWMNNGPMQPMQQHRQQVYQQQQQQQQQPQMYAQPPQQQYSMNQGQPAAPPSYFDSVHSVGWNGQQSQPPMQQQQQFPPVGHPQYNTVPPGQQADGVNGAGRVNGGNFQSNPRGQQQQFNSVQTASFNGGGWYPGPQNYQPPQQNPMQQVSNDGFTMPMSQVSNGRIINRAQQQQNMGSNIPLSLPNNNSCPPQQQSQSPFLRPLPPAAHFVKPHPPPASPYRSVKTITSESLSMSEETYSVLLTDLCANGSLQCDKSDFDQYILEYNPDPQELRNQVRENNEQFKDIVEILGPSVLESKHRLSSSSSNDSVPMNVDECSSSSLSIPPSPMDVTVGTDSGPKMRLDDFYIPQTKWIEACKRTNMIKSAEILFRCLFSDEEIINCTIKGKGDTRVLDPCKKVAIIRAISWIVSNFQDGMNVDPLSYDCLAALECTLTAENKKVVEKKIFTSYRNQLKIKLTKVKGKVQDGKEVLQKDKQLKRPFPFPPDPPLDS